MKQKHICLIIDDFTNKTLAEYEIEAEDWYYARHIAAREFQNTNGGGNWHVDSIELGDLT